MRTNLSVEDLGDLVEQALVATLATYRKNGEVLLSPVWYEWKNNGFNLFVGRNDFKAQHIRRDPRASIVVYENALPLRGLEVRGTAKFFTEGVGELRARVWQRYLGIDPIGSSDEEIGVRLEGTIRAWDFADWNVSP